jgi:hypothetical protein
VSLILVGCGIQNSLKEDVITPTKTAIAPSSTIKLTEAAISNTSETPLLTPLPTLPASETFEYLFMSENKCNVPCWWSIVPGISTWTETKQFIEQFSELSFGVQRAYGKKPITKTSSPEIYVWYVGNPMPNTDSATTIYLDVQNNVVTALEIGPELVWNFYPINKLLETYGRPDQILISDINNDVNSQMLYARIYLLYNDKHILTSYGYSGSSSASPLNICLYEDGEGYMYMWSHSTDLDFNFSSMKSLEEYSNLDLNAFYEEFTDDKNQCLEISEDVWK